MFLAAILLLMLVRPAPAPPPPLQKLSMTGRMLGRDGETRIGLTMTCAYYEEGETYCEGRWRCQATRDGKCRQDGGKAALDIPDDPTWWNGWRDGDPRERATTYLSSQDGAKCTAEGMVPFTYGHEVPGFYGAFKCTAPGGAIVDEGNLAYRTWRVGKVYFGYD